MLTEAKKKFIEFMMSADVLRFGDFTTKSGRKTPYFVNTGNYKTGMQNSRLGEFYAALVKETALAIDFDAMFGPAYKGIPLATSVSGALRPQLRHRQAVLLQPQGGRRTTARAAASSATSRRTATASSSSRTLSPQAPRSVRPCRCSRAARTSR